MRVLELSLASSCPMNCHYCAQSTLKAAYHGPRLMTVKIFKSALHNAGAIEQLSFAGFAEPYLNPRCTEMVEWASMHGVPTVIYTTCIGMTIADVEALERLKPQAVTIHLVDGDGNMKFEPTEDYLRTLAKLISTRLDIRLMAMGSIHPAVLPVLKGRKAGGLESMQSRAGNVGGFVQIGNRGALKCRPAPELDHPVMLPDGRLVLCCQDYGLRHVLGNLAEQTWDEIYAGEAFQSLRASMKDGDCLCRGCEYAQSA